MAFAKMGSAIGVAFTRDPSTDETYLYGEYLIIPQEEKVMTGIRTSNPIKHTKPLPRDVNSTLADEMPEIHEQIDVIRQKLENHYRDIQDIKFTIQECSKVRYTGNRKHFPFWLLPKLSIYINSFVSF
jgi:pyruvate,orthophosphate dikinase